MMLFKDGITREATPDETAEILATQAAVQQTLVNSPAAMPVLYAVALLTVSGGEIGGIGVQSRFSAAIYVDVGLYYIFFAETQPDTNYLAKGYDGVARVSVIEKTTDYIVVQALDANGDPVDPAEVSIEIIRVS